jgi:uncharacterized membrane protein
LSFEAAGSIKPRVAPAYNVSWRHAASRMVERRIKPYAQQLDEDARRQQQNRAFRRNQIFGLLILAAVILVWWLMHTNPQWIFPTGWWRP